MVNTLTLPSIIQQPFAANGDKNIIPNQATGTGGASFEEGFPQITQQALTEGGIPPVRRDFNGILNIMSEFYFFNQNGGTYTYNPTVAANIGGYPLNAVLWYFGSDGTKSLVVSNIGNNTNNFVENPSLIGSGQPWSFISTEKGNLPLGTIIAYDAPTEDFGLEPLNSISYPQGLLLSNVSNTYPDFWELCLKRKNLAATDNRYARYAKTQAQYTEELNSKGFCGWYVVDETNNTIRLPYYGQAFMQGYTSGDVDKQAGLPNITGSSQAQDGYIRSSHTASGAISSLITAKGSSRTGDGGNTAAYFNFNASWSNPIYGRSSTVQPNSIGVYYYIVVSSVVTTIGKAEWEAKQDVANLVTTLSASSTNQQYPSAKCVYDLIGDVETLLSQV